MGVCTLTLRPDGCTGVMNGCSEVRLEGTYIVIAGVVEPKDRVDGSKSQCELNCSVHCLTGGMLPLSALGLYFLPLYLPRDSHR